MDEPRRTILFDHLHYNVHNGTWFCEDVENVAEHMKERGYPNCDAFVIMGPDGLPHMHERDTPDDLIAENVLYLFWREGDPRRNG